MFKAREINMEKTKYDAIIIGAGFAGVSAARELSQAGYTVLILEGRDRIGGRTWVDERLGSQLELGGAWVHWFQPHIWSEISRYGLPIKPSPKPQKAYWVGEGKPREGTLDDLYQKMDEAMKIFLRDSMKYFPYPYEPLNQFERLEEIDFKTVEAQLKELSLKKEVYDLLYSFWSLQFHNTLEEAALTQAYRLAALVNNQWKLIFETSSVYKIVGGTKNLIKRMLEDASGADLRLSTNVATVEKGDNKYKVLTKEGGIYMSRIVIAAVPLNVLTNIEFSPPLSIKKQQASVEKYDSKGFKFWARVRGVTSSFVLVAPVDRVINYVQVEEIQEEEAIIVGFGSDSRKLDINNHLLIERELQEFLPEIQVLESTGHDWVADHLSKGTWAMLKKNQLTEYFSELQKEEGGLFFAGSDLANGWAGFIDGAIESGIATGKRVSRYFQGKEKLRQ